MKSYSFNVKHLLGNWLAARIPLSQLSVEHMRNKSVPAHKFSFVYFLGGLTLVCLIVQAVSGLLLLLNYQPLTVSANQSVRYLQLTIPGGSLVHNLHAWAANAMVVLIFLHAVSVSIYAAYRKPRELTWTSGVISLFLVFGMAFTGYLLPWNTLSVYATKVAVQIISSSTTFLPPPLSSIGNNLTIWILGTDQVGQDMLTRFYSLHICILPAALLALVAFHLLLVQLHGMSLLPSKKPPALKSELFFPNFLLKDLSLWWLLLTVLIVLSTLLPYDAFMPYTLAQPYDPTRPAPYGIKPEWYFYFLYYPLEIFPRDLVFAATGLFFALFLFYPVVIALLNRIIAKPALTDRLAVLIPILVASSILLIILFGQNWVDFLKRAGS